MIPLESAPSRASEISIKRQLRFCLRWSSRDAMFQGGPFQQLHSDEALAVILSNFINRANVGVIQGRSCTSLPAEPLERLRVLGEVIRQKLECTAIVGASSRTKISMPTESSGGHRRR